MRCAPHLTRMRKNRNANRVLVRNLAGKRPLGRLGCKLKGNIKIYLKKKWGVGDGVD